MSLVGAFISQDKPEMSHILPGKPVTTLNQHNMAKGMLFQFQSYCLRGLIVFILPLLESHHHGRSLTAFRPLCSEVVKCSYEERVILDNPSAREETILDISALSNAKWRFEALEN